MLLVSASFLASDYCYEKEMARAIERHEEGSAVVIPVILHPCDWHSAPFGRLRATPTDGKPISMFANQQEALSIVAKDVREVAMRIAAKLPATSQAQESSARGIATHDERSRSSNMRIRRTFDDHEKDGFLEDSYEYIARYFESSLEELPSRNPQIKSRFKRIDAKSFSASLYENGKRVAQCTIWQGSQFRDSSIFYSNTEDAQHSSYNESLSVVEDGYTLQLKPLGMQFAGRQADGLLSQQGAAEFLWEMLLHPLQ